MKKATKEKKEITKIKFSHRDYLADEYSETPLLFMDPDIYDHAILGVIEGKAHELTVAYDYDRVININMEQGSNRYGV